VCLRHSRDEERRCEYRDDARVSQQPTTSAPDAETTRPLGVALPTSLSTLSRVALPTVAHIKIVSPRGPDGCHIALATRSGDQQHVSGRDEQIAGAQSRLAEDAGVGDDSASVVIVVVFNEEFLRQSHATPPYPCNGCGRRKVFVVPPEGIHGARRGLRRGYR
jgi:hypothetical protein